MNEEVNELKPQLLGIHALNSFAMNNSASRGFMFASHFTQHLVTNGMQEKIIQAGPEQELAKYTLGVRMPENGKIIAVIQKYPSGVGLDSLKLNPETLVVYENAENGMIDCFTIPGFRSFHQYFGWPCEPREGLDHLRPGAFIPKDTVFADTPGVKDGNSYMYGRNVNVAYMSIPAVAEDGIVVARGELQNWKYKVYDTRIVEWGSNSFPIDIYGRGKPFPDIGEEVRDDGLLMALRPYEQDMFAVDIGIHDLTRIDYVFDKPTYVRHGKGRVVDLEIISNNNPLRNMPIGMADQADKYVQAYLRYQKEILAVEDRLRYERKQKYGTGQAKLFLSPRFNKVLVRALALTNYRSDQMKQILKLLYRKEQIDEYYAKFVIEYEVTPNLGDKLSNSSGSKGVICKIMEDHEMPVRPDGVRADMIIDPGPVFHRMNIGQAYEQYITCAVHDVVARITCKLGFIPTVHMEHFDNRPEVTQDQILEMNPELIAECYAYLMTFYRVFNDTMPEFFGNLSREDQAEHLCDIINAGVCYLYLPVDNPRLPDAIVEDIERLFQPTHTTVVYGDLAKRHVETVKKIRIGKVYMFLLDKPASEWSATSTARLQHFGILSSVTKSEKFAYPYRNSPTRLSGETESRIFACYTGPESIAEMFDRTNNPITRRNVYWNLLEAENPSQIKRIVDRNVVPLGASRPIQIVNHIFMCSGFRPEYYPEVAVLPNRKKEGLTR